MEELQATNDKLDRSKKKTQAELDDVTVDLDAQRAKLVELEKKQRNFDKTMNEEKVRACVSRAGRCDWLIRTAVGLGRARISAGQARAGRAQCRWNGLGRPGGAYCVGRIRSGCDIQLSLADTSSVCWRLRRTGWGPGGAYWRVRWVGV